METLLLTGAVCLAVGLLIGWSSVAGFLLPIFFISYLHLPATEALGISFLCFAVSGAIGALNFHRAGQLPLKTGLQIGLGSLAGALLGAGLNQLIPAATVKNILYVVVLLSGLSILLRRQKPDREEGSAITERPMLLLILGFVTGAICALSGAGGPILVMPLLVALGVRAHAAIGIALLDSVFIALPALCIYFTAALPAPWLLALCAGTHALGVLVGSSTAHRVPGGLLKKLVGVFSVCIAIYMLFF
ncbi:MAG: sulfite exporter TauE/SafE family protein [Pseudoflavonifractor sp.]